MKLQLQLDIYNINNPHRFQGQLSYNDLIEAFVFGSGQSIEAAKQLKKAISLQIINIRCKWLYVGFKWLIFFHQCLNLTQQNDNGQSLTVKTILDLLNQIEHPKAWTKHQEYLLKKVFIPYLQYLVKIASALQIKSQTPSSLQHYIFLEFNLLRFAIAEFMLPICEFNRYFKQRYPHLSKIFNMLSKQIYILHKKVTLHYQLKQLQQMHFIEVDQLAQSLVFFSTQKQASQKRNSTMASSEAIESKNEPVSEKAIQQFQGMERTSIMLNS